MADEKFQFSGHPRNIEWYRCYDDVGSTDWLDGMELYGQKDSWDERAIAKWCFFYRPFRPVVGRPQKKMIGQRRAAICSSEAYIQESRAEIARQQGIIRGAESQLTVWLCLAAGLAALLFFQSKWLIIFPVIAGLHFLSKFNKTSNAAQKAITELNARIKDYTENINRDRHEIKSLQDEIDHLLAQVPRVVDAETIETWLLEELAEIECACLSEFMGTPVTNENIRTYISQDFGDPRVAGLLVDSWGFLQPTSQKGPLGREGTGLRRATDDLRQHVTTWRVDGRGNPVFRLLFLQYIFPLEKNLNVGTLFYDFVTRRAYGKRLETFQYNHITNYSIREVEPQEEPWMEELGLTTMSQLLQGKTPKALTIAVASGSHFRCVLVDEDVVDALNECLKQEEKYKELEASLLTEAELQERFRGNQALIDSWKLVERARIEEEMKDIAREKQHIQWKTGRTAKAMLSHVRSCVEEYVLRSQAPA